MHTEIIPKKVWEFQQRWREVFSKKVKAQKGRWIYRGFDWHAFSYNFAQYKEGSNAYESYKRIKEQNFIIISEDEGSPSFSCTSERAPDLSNFMGDYYVFPETLEWTMVFTHEDGLGPYFARKEWQ